MKYFLRTAYGDSKNFSGSTIEVKFQGFCQGNGAAPASWAVVSITIVAAHKKKGHCAHFVCPISKITGHLAAILFVDDTDLLHINLRAEESVHSAHQALQDSIYNWGQLLIASGGAFKPIKCFYHIISYDWKPDGRWVYAANKDNEDFDIRVPLPDGTSVPIKHAGVDEAKENLGVWSCPSGDPSAALKRMQDKTQSWIDRAKEGHLTRRDAWFLMERQMWPGTSYVLGSSTASWEQLDLCLKKQW